MITRIEVTMYGKTVVIEIENIDTLTFDQIAQRYLRAAFEELLSGNSRPRRGAR